MRAWLVAMGLVGCAGVAFILCVVVMLVGCGFGMYKSFEQMQRHAAFAEKCEAAGGVYRRAKYESPACYRRDAFLRVQP